MLSCLKAPLLSKIDTLSHGFFGSSHGLSKENAKQHEVVFKRVGHELGILPKNFITLKQMHSPDALIVDGPFLGEVPTADALITKTPGLLLGIYTADCVPILLSTLSGDMVAAIHAGWRGAFKGVIENT